MTEDTKKAIEEVKAGMDVWHKITKVTTDDGFIDELMRTWTFRDRIALEFRARVVRPIGRLKWWLFHRLHPSHRYHMVNTGLPYGYHDTDLRMEAAIIRLFLEFIEEEKPWEFKVSIEKLREIQGKDRSGEKRTRDWIEIRHLYDYFKGIDLMNPAWEDCSDFKWGESRECTFNRFRRDAGLKRQFDYKLGEVVRLRGHYWT